MSHNAPSLENTDGRSHCWRTAALAAIYQWIKEGERRVKTVALPKEGVTTPAVKGQQVQCPH